MKNMILFDSNNFKIDFGVKNMMRKKHPNLVVLFRQNDKKK